jgi:hypothetical protein
VIAILILEALGHISYNEVPEPLQRPFNRISNMDMIDFYGESWRKGRMISVPTAEPRKIALALRH